jgi:putative methionine-R-sulfoxide reductase with GAF domain
MSVHEDLIQEFREFAQTELDIESYFSNTFTHPERAFVEECTAIVEKYLSKSKPD